MNIIYAGSMKVPLKIWGKQNIDDAAIDQMKKVCSLPVVGKHVALMPDAHVGMGACIGGVVPLRDVIIPSLVGSDIACGIYAMKTSFNGKLSVDILEKLIKLIPQEIPCGVGGAYKGTRDALSMPQLEMGDVVIENFDNALLQLGTLGAGNHFIEIQSDLENNVWLMLHSGSRNLGYNICKHYAGKAKAFHKEWCINSPENLEWLLVSSDLGRAYITEMTYAMEYALLSRADMMNKVLSIFKQVMVDLDGAKIICEQRVHIPHNYAKLENHFDQNFWVHRKGAIKIEKDALGILPGSMGTNSYIVTGTGNTDSFLSASHGAGRIKSRTAFNKETALCDAEKEMEGIPHTEFRRNKKRKKVGAILDLSETPSAYKNIEKVVEAQKELINVEVTLRPLASIKG